MSTLKQKTISGFLWSFTDFASKQLISFVIGIILARLLLPREFGLIGMITIFIAISTSFINSGFGTALIRKSDCTSEDYSTVFYFNLVVGILFYLVLFFTSDAISRYFNEPQLTKILRVLSIVLIIDSLTIIQRTILIKRVDFKLQTKISVISSIISGSIGITMAFTGFGVWSLVGKQIIQRITNSLLLWLWNRWRPILVFSRKSFIELFSFGYKLLLVSLMATMYNNVYYFLIGRYFSATDLGYYTRADQFSKLASTSLISIVSQVSFPVLAQMQDDKIFLKENFKKISMSVMLISFVVMIGMATIAEPMIITLIGEKWRESIVYLQLLCIAGIMYPLNLLNLQILNVFGRSDLVLRLEIIKILLAVPIIVTGVYIGISAMIVGLIIHGLAAFFISSTWSGKFINYSAWEQVLDIIPSFLLVVTSFLLVYLIGIMLPINYLPKLIVQVFFGGLITLFLCEITRLKSYLLLKQVIQNKIKDILESRK